MNRMLQLIVLCALPAITYPAMAGTKSGRVITAKRLLSECMTKEMAASRTLSYNAATHLCKARLLAAGSAAGSSGNGNAVGKLGR